MHMLPAKYQRNRSSGPGEEVGLMFFLPSMGMMAVLNFES